MYRSRVSEFRGGASWDTGARGLAVARLIVKYLLFLEARISAIQPGQDVSDQIDLDAWTWDSTAA